LKIKNNYSLKKDAPKEDLKIEDDENTQLNTTSDSL
jgi:hypothetical protein